MTPTQRQTLGIIANGATRCYQHAEGRTFIEAAHTPLPRPAVERLIADGHALVHSPEPRCLSGAVTITPAGLAALAAAQEV